MKLIKWAASFFSTPLPTGMTQFKMLMNDVAELSGLPNNPKLHAVAAELILQLKPNTDRYPKRRFAKELRKLAANQVACEVLSLQREKDKEENSAKSADQAVGQETA